MVRGDARERAAVDIEPEHAQGGVDENVVDGEGGEGGRESAKCSDRRDQCSHVTEMLAERTVCPRAWQAIEIAQQNGRRLGRTSCQPFLVQQLRLEQALASTQAEMRVDDM